LTIPKEGKESLSLELIKEHKGISDWLSAKVGVMVESIGNKKGSTYI